MENIDDIIDLLTETGGGHAVGEGNIKDAVAMLLQMKEAAAAPDPTNWQEKSRQLTAETVEETTRLLATKFVADEAVKLVGELVGVLELVLQTGINGGDNIRLVHIGMSHKDLTSESHKMADASEDATNKAYAAIAKAAQFTNATTQTAPTVGGETEPQTFPPVDAVPEYVPDWGGVSFRFKWVAVDPNGFVFAYEIAPMIGVESWVVSTKAKVNETDFYLSSKIPPPPGDTWKKMIYKRPK